MPHTIAALCDKHDETPSEAETMEQSRDATKLSLPIVMVCGLMLVIGGGAFSFATLFEQNKRHELLLSQFTESMTTLKVAVATQGQQIQSLTDQLSRIERGNGRS